MSPSSRWHRSDPGTAPAASGAALGARQGRNGRRVTRRHCPERLRCDAGQRLGGALPCEDWAVLLRSGLGCGPAGTGSAAGGGAVGRARRARWGSEALASAKPRKSSYCRPRFHWIEPKTGSTVCCHSAYRSRPSWLRSLRHMRPFRSRFRGGRRRGNVMVRHGVTDVPGRNQHVDLHRVEDRDALGLEVAGVHRDLAGDRPGLGDGLLHQRAAVRSVRRRVVLSVVRWLRSGPRRRGRHPRLPSQGGHGRLDAYQPTLRVHQPGGSPSPRRRPRLAFSHTSSATASYSA